MLSLSHRKPREPSCIQKTCAFLCKGIVTPIGAIGGAAGALQLAGVSDVCLVAAEYFMDETIKRPLHEGTIIAVPFLITFACGSSAMLVGAAIGSVATYFLVDRISKRILQNANKPR